MSIKEALEKVKSRAGEIKKTAVELLEAIPKPLSNRPTIILREPIIKRIMDRRMERVKRKAESQY